MRYILRQGDILMRGRSLLRRIWKFMVMCVRVGELTGWRRLFATQHVLLDFEGEGGLGADLFSDFTTIP